MLRKLTDIAACLSDVCYDPSEVSEQLVDMINGGEAAVSLGRPVSRLQPTARTDPTQPARRGVRDSHATVQAAEK